MARDLKAVKLSREETKRFSESLRRDFFIIAPVRKRGSSKFSDADLVQSRLFLRKAKVTGEKNLTDVTGPYQGKFFLDKMIAIYYHFTYEVVNQIHRLRDESPYVYGKG